MVAYVVMLPQGLTVARMSVTDFEFTRAGRLFGFFLLLGLLPRFFRAAVEFGFVGFKVEVLLLHDPRLLDQAVGLFLELGAALLFFFLLGFLFYRVLFFLLFFKSGLVFPVFLFLYFLLFPLLVAPLFLAFLFFFSCRFLMPRRFLRHGRCLLFFSGLSFALQSLGLADVRQGHRVEVGQARASLRGGRSGDPL